MDIGRLVPLAEAWDSGASDWSAKEREAYANDLGDERALIAVSAASNRSRADQDPSTWLPSAAGYRCQYVTGWVATMMRWGPERRHPRAGRDHRGPWPLSERTRHHHTGPLIPRPDQVPSGAPPPGGRGRVAVCSAVADPARLVDWVPGRGALAGGRLARCQRRPLRGRRS
ncbi:HNH endonuclease family protein [Streptomyces olivaceoviridis]|uniref:HNH endonuclease family protein n=1 Tax=Streptomyces olivaceoviridis TaxID=1921 RepID=UPI003570DB87